MNKKMKLLIVFMMISITTTSCVRDEKEEVEKIDEVEELEAEEEIEELTTEEILEFVLDRKDERENYSLKYDGDYYCKSKSVDLEDENFADLDLEDVDLDFEIKQKDEVYHYQDGRGRFKTILYRNEDEEKKENIIVYDKNRYIIYDSDMKDENINSSDVWELIKTGEYENNIPGFFVTDSQEEFEDLKLYGKMDYPENPLDDMVSLLEIYNFSDMYKVKRLRDKEDDNTFILNLLSYEENVDVVFFIDKENFYIKSYKGHNGDATFSGEIVDMEEYLEYDREFFTRPDKL